LVLIKIATLMATLLDPVLPTQPVRRSRSKRRRPRQENLEEVPLSPVCTV